MRYYCLGAWSFSVAYPIGLIPLELYQLVIFLEFDPSSRMGSEMGSNLNARSESEALLKYITSECILMHSSFIYDT